MERAQAIRFSHFRKPDPAGRKMLGGRRDMDGRDRIVFGAALFFSGAAATLSPASAQSFQSYRCADGTQFIVGFFEYDKRAHLQIDGKAVTLGRRPTLSGAR